MRTTMTALVALLGVAGTAAAQTSPLHAGEARPARGGEISGKQIKLTVGCSLVPVGEAIPCGAGPLVVRLPARDGKAGRVLAKGTMPQLAAGEQRVVTATVVMRERRRMRDSPSRSVSVGIGNQGADDRPKRWTWSPVVLSGGSR